MLYMKIIDKLFKQVNYSLNFKYLTGLFLASIGFQAHASSHGLNTSNGWNMMPGVTDLSSNIYDLHMIILYICIVIAVGVFTAMGYSIYKHRKSKGAKAAQFHENTTVELVWTIIPLIVLIAIAVPATQVVIDREDVSKADMQIKVTGHQWKWQYEYLDNQAKGISFISNLDKRSIDQIARSFDEGIVPSYENYVVDVDNRLLIPTGKRIRFLITANDVIHSWWVPDFGLKQDAIPGFVNSTWAEVPVGKEGIYRGACTELCGRGHAYMPVVVEAVSQAEFDKWVVEKQGERQKQQQLATKEWTKEELLTQGKTLYNANCAACHLPDGRGVTGQFPAIVGSKIATGSKKEHVTLVLNGLNLMPAFRQLLDDTQLAAIVTYQRSGLNQVGDHVQPKEIKALR